MFQSKLRLTVFAGLVLFASMAPAKAVVVLYTLTFQGTGGGSGTLTLNETSLGNENESSINSLESFSGTVDGQAITINSTTIGNGSWNINLSGSTFNNLGLTSNQPSGPMDVVWLQTSGSNGYGLHQTHGDDLVNFGNFTISGPTIASAVPELSTWAMMIVGFCGLGLMAYRRKIAVRFA
jgi:hypothetical protein